MRLGRALFAVVVSFFVSTASLSVARELAHSKDSTLLSSHPIIGHGGAEGRSLRAVGTENDSSELRGFWGYAKALWWADWGVSEDYVMKALKLKGLKGEALAKHKNYKTFEYFVEKSEKYKINKWAVDELTSFQVWEKLGLATVTKASDLKKIRHTREFRMYKDYANYFDTDVLRMMKAGYNPPRQMVSRGALEAEMTARAEILAEAGRSTAYAKLALGMSESTYPQVVLLYGPALERSGDFKYFKLFLKHKKPALEAELKDLTTKASSGLTRGQKKRKGEVLEELGLIENYVARANGGGVL